MRWFMNDKQEEIKTIDKNQRDMTIEDYAMIFFHALSNVYAPYKKKVKIPRLNITEDMTEQLTGMIIGLALFYQTEIDENANDIFDFVSLINKLCVQWAFQVAYDKSQEDEDIIGDNIANNGVSNE